METQNIIMLAGIGIVSGILSGIMGLGGAIIIIPAMVMLMGYSQQMAQGTTLMMMVLPVGGMAAFEYYKNGYVDMKAALIMAVFFFVGGYLGAKVATQFPQELLRKGFAIVLAIIAVKMFFMNK